MLVSRRVHPFQDAVPCPDTLAVVGDTLQKEQHDHAGVSAAAVARQHSSLCQVRTNRALSYVRDCDGVHVRTTQPHRRASSSKESGSA